jgi:excisionase family DNA binding protein
MQVKQMTIAPAAFSISDAAQYLGIGRTKLYEYINAGVLPVVHFGKRTLIRRVDLDALLTANQHHTLQRHEAR